MNYQDDENDYSIDSDYQNDEEDGRDEEAGTSLPSMMETPPEITSKSKNLVVPEGSDVVLPCDVLNKG